MYHALRIYVKVHLSAQNIKLDFFSFFIFIYLFIHFLKKRKKSTYMFRSYTFCFWQFSSESGTSLTSSWDFWYLNTYLIKNYNWILTKMVKPELYQYVLVDCHVYCKIHNCILYSAICLLSYFGSQKERYCFGRW